MIVLCSFGFSNPKEQTYNERPVYQNEEDGTWIFYGKKQWKVFGLDDGGVKSVSLWGYTVIRIIYLFFFNEMYF